MEIRYQINDIEHVAEQVLRELTSRTILLKGDMGVGKTTFVKSFVKVLGSLDTVSSPTFSIVNTYELEDGVLYHFDLYRIKDEEEALQFGIEDYLSSNHWIVMEWPENVSNLLQENADVIEIFMNEDHSRTLKLNKNTNITKKYGTKLQNLT